MFNELETNMKGVETRVQLTKFNAIVGDNQSGKTALLRAIRHALTPNPPAAQASRYFKLAPKEADELYARLHENGELVASFSVSRDGKGKVRAPQHSFGGRLRALSGFDIDQLLPSVSYRELLDLGDAKAREALFKRFGQLTSGTPVPRPPALGTEGDALWDRALTEAAKGKVDPAEALAAIGEWMRKEKLRLGKEVKTDKARIDELRMRVEEEIAGAELIPTYEAQYKQALVYEGMSNAREQLTAAEAEWRGLEGEEVALADRARELEERRARAEEAHKARQDEMSQLGAKFQALRGELDLAAARARRVTALVEILDAMVEAGSTTCPIDGGTIDPRACRVDLSAILAQRQSEFGALRDQEEAIVRRNNEIAALYQQDLNAIQADVVRLAQDRAALQTRLAATDARLQLLQAQAASVATYSGLSSAELHEKLQAMRGAQGARRQLEELELGLRQKRVAQDLAKELEERAQKLLETLLKKVVAGAEATVNKYMTAGLVAKLELGDGDCRWCVCNAKDGEPSDKDMMCGAEKSSLIIALALAWTEGAPVRILLLDDEDLGPFHSTPDNLQRFLLALKAAGDDGLLDMICAAGLRADEVPAGWATIQR